MKIKTAMFMRGITGPDPILEDGRPQVALIGRSNVGKSSLINSLTRQKNLARTSPAPGRTKEINVYLINDAFYLLDLPGYGFAHASLTDRQQLQELVDWYLFDSPYEQKKVVLIIDAKVGPTEKDLGMLENLIEYKKPVVVVANKIDKLKKSEYAAQMKNIQDLVGVLNIIPYSTEENIGIKELTNELTNGSTSSPSQPSRALSRD